MLNKIDVQTNIDKYRVTGKLIYNIIQKPERKSRKYITHTSILRLNHK